MEPDSASVSFNEDEFPGWARVFPLPNLVLFPGVAQPLHVFEPRYRELVQDALCGDQLIATGLLKPGWEDDYEGRPEVCSVVCLSKILSHRRLEDGRYMLMLLGLRRLQLTCEQAPWHSFRVFSGKLLREVTPQQAEAGRMRKAVLDQVAHCLKQAYCPDDDWAEAGKLRFDDFSLSQLCDLLAYSAPLPIEKKQQLLSELDVLERARQLLAGLEQVARCGPTPPLAYRDFPPPFSSN